MIKKLPEKHIIKIFYNEVDNHYEAWLYEMVEAELSAVTFGVGDTVQESLEALEEYMELKGLNHE